MATHRDLMALADGDAARLRAAKEWASDTGQDVDHVLDNWRERRERTAGILGGPDRARFVHFTDRAGADAIKGSGQIHTSSGIRDAVYAAPVGGADVPGVQQGTTTDRGFGRVAGAREWAVLFSADATPEDCVAEEVIWRRAGPLPVRDATVVPAAWARRLLDESAGIPEPFDADPDTPRPVPGRRLFHGTPADLAVGDLLLPAGVTGAPNYRITGGSHDVFLTATAEEAHRWGEDAVECGAGPTADCPVWVYEVETVGDVTHRSDEDDPGQHVAASARVLGRRRVR